MQIEELRSRMVDLDDVNRMGAAIYSSSAEILMTQYGGSENVALVMAAAEAGGVRGVEAALKTIAFETLRILSSQTIKQPEGASSSTERRPVFVPSRSLASARARQAALQAELIQAKLDIRQGAEFWSELQRRRGRR